MFLPLVRKFTNCSKWWSFKISMNFSPSDGLNCEPDLLSLSGETISLKLKSPRTWTEGGGVIAFMYVLDLIQLTFERLKLQLKFY